MKEISEKEKIETQKQLDQFRKSGMSYLSKQDEELDFSNCDKPKIEENDTNRSTE